MSNESTVKPKIEAKMLHVSTYKIKTALSSLEHYIAFDELRGGDSVISNFTNYIEAQPALSRIAELEAINAKLKACADFYADRQNWIHDKSKIKNTTIILQDGETNFCETTGGKLARETLAEIAQLEQKVKGEK